MDSWRIIELLRGRLRASRRKENGTSELHPEGVPGLVNVSELIERALAETGATLLPHSLVDLAGGVSAHADVFLHQQVEPIVDQRLPEETVDQSAAVGALEQLVG